MTEALTSTEKSKKQRDNIKNATKNFDYTTIADRLRTVSWGNDSHPAGVRSVIFRITSTSGLIMGQISPQFLHTFSVNSGVIL